MRKYGIRNGTSSSQNAPLCKEEDKNNNNPIYSLDMQQTCTRALFQICQEKLDK